MKRLSMPLLFLAALTPASAATVSTSEGCKPIPGSYIVVFNESSEAQQTSPPDLAIRLAAAYGGEVRFVYEHALRGYNVREMKQAAAESLAADPAVAYVEQNCEAYLAATQTGPPWGLDRIDQLDLPLSNTYTYGSTGAGVHAYVVDTGLRSTHGELAGRVGTGATFWPGTADTEDCHGHGTHVSGTLAGSTYGVAKQAIVHPVRVFGCGDEGDAGVIIAGVDWVVANRVLPAVANLSVQTSPSSAITTAINNLIGGGTTVVVAAANNSQDACNETLPSIADTIAVAASTITDSRATGFSNFGPCVDLFAPGDNILSAWFNSDSATNTISGTSMASPHVAGVAARFLQADPGASPAAVAQAIVDKATAGRLSNIGAGSPNLLLYSGFLDVDAPPVACFSPSCSGQSCTFNAGCSTDDQGIASYQWTFGDSASGSGSPVTHAYASPGTYNVVLTVTDTAGQPGSTSQNVTVTCGDTTAPTVTITSPTPGQSVSGTVTVQASASDNVGVTQVQFLVDGALRATDTTAPYSFAWDTAVVAAGSHTLTAKAFDACGNVRTSAAVGVTVIGIPDIAVHQNSNGAGVPAGSTVSLGSTPISVPISLRFEIRNTGNGALSLTNAAALVSGACFSQIETPATPVPAGGTSFFRVRLQCPTANTYNGTVSIGSNDPNENPYTFFVTGTVTQPPAPDIAVHRNSNGVEVPPGSSVSLGSTQASVPTSLRFEIRNTGNAALNLGNAASLVSGACFSQIETPVTPVPAGGTSYFRVRLQCASAGSYNGTVSIGSDDPNENPYTFFVTGTVTPPPAPDVAVHRNSNGQEVPAGSTVSLGSTLISVPTSLRFEIRNTGNASLNLGNAASLVSGACFSQIETPVTPVPAGGISYFRVRLQCPAAGSYNGTVSIGSDDPNENPYTFFVTGTVTAPPPDIAVHLNSSGAAVPRGGSVSIGTTTVSVPTSLRFQIRNTGSGPLNLGNAASLVSGGCFSQIETPVTPVPAGGTSFFRVRLQCASAGSYSGSVSIASDDPDENPYSFTVTGTVTN